MKRARSTIGLNRVAMRAAGWRARAGLLMALMFNWSCFGAGDIFEAKKMLPGGYRLVRFEVDTYYVGYGATIPGGALGGAVTRIGWNEAYIVAWRAGLTGNSGWMIVDIEAGRIEGPLTDDELRLKVQSTPKLEGINVRTAAEAWSAMP